MIRALLFLVTLATSVYAVEETPLQYVIDCLGVKKAGGKVIDSWSALKWPRIIDKEPPAGLCECCCYFEATVDIRWKGSSWKDFLAANGFKRDNAIPILGDIPALAKLFNDPKDPNLYFSRDIDLPRLGSIEISASVSGKNLKARVMHLSISRFTRYYICPDTTPSKPVEPDKGETKPEDKTSPKDQPKTHAPKDIHP